MRYRERFPGQRQKSVAEPPVVAETAQYPRP